MSEIIFQQLRDALLSDADNVAERERAWAQAMHARNDAARADAPRYTLTAVTDFTLFDDENPMGRVVRMGDEFQVSEFDLQRYLGKGHPRAGELVPP